MNWKKSLSIAVVIVMIFSLAACGGSKEDGSQESASISSAEQQEVINQLAEEAAAVPEPDTQAAVEAAATQDSSTVQDSSAATDKLTGEWADINDAARVVKITSNGSEYQYADPDGTYAGTVKDGVLTIQISDAENDTAEVFIDAKTGNLVTNYQGDIYEFTKKLQQ
jgi:hypothetical protein